MAGGPGGSHAGLSKGARITGDQRSSLATAFGERYAGGESIRSIAADTGRSYGFVHGVLKESGATLRGRGGATRGPRRGAVETVVDAVEAAVAQPLASAARTKAKAGKDQPAKSSKAEKAKAAKDEKPKKKAEAKKAGKKGKKG